LYLKLTKGHGRDWCHTMNTMVAHALNTAWRVSMLTRQQMLCPMSGSNRDKALIAALLKEEAMLAIAEEGCDPNNMYEFEHTNFKYIWLSGDSKEDEAYARELPVTQIQDMRFAFAMLTHARLGEAALGNILGNDTIKLILSDKCF
jgi:hypothetical protein